MFDTVDITFLCVIGLGVGFIVGMLYGTFSTMDEVCTSICNSNDMNYDDFSYSRSQEAYVCHCEGEIKDISTMDIVIGG